MSDLDDVVWGVFVIGGDVQSYQDALTVLVPHLGQSLQEAPVLCGPLVVSAEPFPHNGPPEHSLFECFQHWFGVHVLQYSYVNTQRKEESEIMYSILFDDLYLPFRQSLSLCRLLTCSIFVWTCLYTCKVGTFWIVGTFWLVLTFSESFRFRFNSGWVVGLCMWSGLFRMS